MVEINNARARIQEIPIFLETREVSDVFGESIITYEALINHIVDISNNFLRNFVLVYYHSRDFIS